MIEEMLDIPPRACKEIVDAEDLVATFEQRIGEMRTEKACSAGN